MEVTRVPSQQFCVRCWKVLTGQELLIPARTGTCAWSGLHITTRAEQSTLTPKHAGLGQLAQCFEMLLRPRIYQFSITCTCTTPHWYKHLQIHEANVATRDCRDVQAHQWIKRDISSSLVHPWSFFIIFSSHDMTESASLLFFP